MEPSQPPDVGAVWPDVRGIQRMLILLPNRFTVVSELATKTSPAVARKLGLVELRLVVPWKRRTKNEPRLACLVYDLLNTYL